jgi:hypothetical protein
LEFNGNIYLSIVIIRQLLATLPDIFEDSETLVQLACQVIKSYHGRRRFASKQQIQSAAPSSRKSKLVMSVIVVCKFHVIFQKPRIDDFFIFFMLLFYWQPTRAALEKEREAEAAKNQKENDIIVIDITLDDGAEHEKHDDKQKNKVEIVEPKLPLMTDLSNQLPGPATIKGLSRSTSALNFNSPQLLSALPSSSSHNNSQNTPLHAESSTQAQSSNNSRLKQDNHEDAFKLTGVTRIAGFLNACSPPMAHFLQPFIDFGCTSEEYLVAVSTWQSEKISHFLRQVVSHRNDKHKFSQMDMLILQNHFISYFNKTQMT